MKIHEYQAKSLLKKYGIPIQDGYVIENINNAEDTILKVKNDFKSKDVVIKAQIHAGGRGKGGGEKETSLPERRCLLITRLSAESLCCSVGMFFPLNVFAPTTWMFR